MIVHDYSWKMRELNPRELNPREGTSFW